MTTSMTGFGRAVQEAPFGKIVVEIQSVNRKYLEIFVSLPEEYARFEMEARKQVSEEVIRGQVSVRILIYPNEEAAGFDLKRLKMLKGSWEKAAKQLGFEKSEITLAFLLERAESKGELAEDDLKPIGRCLKEALEALVAMKKKEGSALAKDISFRLKLLEKLLSSIQAQAPHATVKQRQKLKERMEEIFQPSVELDERLLREVALFAEKVDISEEVTRFRSHLSQFFSLLKGKGGGVGRKMDFLVQEMGREVNTIGSKSLEVAITTSVVEMKSELEKIREQIQNIE